MRKIKKSAQPDELREFVRLNPGVRYDSLPGDVKAVLRVRLCEDQGSLCAYCMSAIDERPATREDFIGLPVRSSEAESATQQDHPNRLHGSTIEHWIPQSIDRDKSLEWTNLLGVCSGRRDRREEAHCDAARENKPLNHLNPLASVPVSSLLDWRTASVRRGGARPYEVKGLVVQASSRLDEQTRAEINIELETLRLNVGWLAESRQQQLQTLRERVQKKFNGGMITKEWIETQRRKLTTPDERGRLLEYVGVLLWQLELWERKAR